jgi:hypothetical protein
VVAFGALPYVACTRHVDRKPWCEALRSWKFKLRYFQKGFELGS